MTPYQSIIVYAGTRRYRPLLNEVLEAYRVFLANGSYRIAWRNLAVFLTSYLIQYFRYEHGLPPQASSVRANHLSSLPNSHFGCLTAEVVYVLLLKSEVLPKDLVSEIWQIADNKNDLQSLCEIDLHRILLDVTIELNHVSTLSIDVSSNWNPLEGVSRNESYSVKLLLDEDSPSIPSDVKPTFLDASKGLLRRALSARLGVGNRLRKPIPREKRLSAPLAQPSALLKESLAPVVSTTYNGNESTNDRLSLTHVNAGWNQYHLHAIPEEEYADLPRRPSSYSGSQSISVRSHSTLESLLDFYNRPFDTGSSISASSINVSVKRSSIDVGQLSRLRVSDSDKKMEQIFDDALSAFSETSGGHSFITALTHTSIITDDDVLRSNRDSIATFLSIATPTAAEDDVIPSPYYAMLQEHDLIPEPQIQTDWSGRGQHTEYHQDEWDQIPLRVESVLGRTRNALVESVRCRRVRLVRKTMRCTKWTGVKHEDVIREIQHLYRVQHSHIVRLVGTYAVGPNLAILTYPCAEWNLEAFMQMTRTTQDATVRCRSLRQFFTCLAKVLDFMHSYPLKHMDIKPQNLLVRDIRESPVNDSDPFKIYFTDFGISRSYETVQECETETPTSFTRAYAAVEVVLQESRGLSADIFSLGCVFAEMIATILDASMPIQTQAQAMHWTALQAARGQTEDNGARPYYSTVDAVRSWLSGLSVQEPELHAVRGWTEMMLHPDASERPLARQIADDPHLPFACLSCTLRTGPEIFECALPLHQDVQTP